jgi:hypothetical protein
MEPLPTCRPAQTQTNPQSNSFNSSKLMLNTFIISRVSLNNNRSSSLHHSKTLKEIPDRDTLLQDRITLMGQEISETEPRVERFRFPI